MAKFIEIHDHIINVENIGSAEFVSDDIYLGMFPVGKDGEMLMDLIPFTFATIELLSGEVIDMQLDLYPPMDGEIEEDWFKRNRAYINVAWEDLKVALGDITQIGGYEYL